MMTFFKFLSFLLSFWTTPSILRTIFFLGFFFPPAQSPHPGNVKSSSLSPSSLTTCLFSFSNSRTTSSPANACLIKSFCLNIRPSSLFSLSDFSLSLSCISLVFKVSCISIMASSSSLSEALLFLFLAIFWADFDNFDEDLSTLWIFRDFCIASSVSLSANQGLTSSASSDTDNCFTFSTSLVELFDFLLETELSTTLNFLLNLFSKLLASSSLTSSNVF
mmetsp:Transcript_7793/g.9828  ORF Transcript_7793/g.9828 Transcript_7793/m.9828 type:complete len:220 (-) Transcript_7793:1856-2515(-)